MKKDLTADQRLAGLTAALLGRARPIGKVTIQRTYDNFRAGEEWAIAGKMLSETARRDKPMFTLGYENVQRIKMMSSTEETEVKVKRRPSGPTTAAEELAKWGTEKEMTGLIYGGAKPPHDLAPEKAKYCRDLLADIMRGMPKPKK